MRFVFCREQLTKAACSFRVAQEQKTSRSESVMEDGHQPLLNDWLKINHQVPATDQVHFGEWRVTHDIVLGKNTLFSNRFANAKTAFFLDKEPAQPFLGKVLHLAFRIKGCPG